MPSLFTDFIESRRALLALPLAMLALQACAQESAEPAAQATAEAAAEPAVAIVDNSNIPAEYAFVVEALPGVVISDVQPAPVDGLLEVTVGSDVFYVSADGKYFMQGEIMDLESRTNVTDTARNRARAVYMEDFSAATAITFAAEDEKYKVMVFTDIDCPYCRKLHREIADYNERGITVQYLMFPRSGPNTASWAKAESVLCAESAQEALTASKNGETLAPAECVNASAVADHYKLGKDLGIGGTPAIYTESGTLIVGYREADALLVLLEEDAS